MSSTHQVHKLPDIEFSGHPDVEAAAKRIFHESVKHLKENFHEFRETGDAGALMQIRIGVRRLRVALYIFRPIIPKETRIRFNREFRYFGNLLSEARNMDVFLGGMLSLEAGKEEHKKVAAELRRRGEELRAEEYDIIAQEISGGHLARTLKDFEKWLGGNWAAKLGRSARKVMESPIAPFALNVIEEGGIELLNQGADVEHLSVAELHDLRKYVKRSRYHLRFFASLFKEAKIEEGFNLLVQMQDCLGLINDVKEGMIILGRLSARIRADYFAEALIFNAAVFRDSSRKVNQDLAIFAALWKEYENFSIDKKDLRKKA